MAKSELIKPQFHIGEFPNGHIVWPAIKYDPKKADMEVPAENPPKFGPDFGQERNGVDDKKDIIPPPEYPPDEFQIKGYGYIYLYVHYNCTHMQKCFA